MQSILNILPRCRALTCYSFDDWRQTKRGEGCPCLTGTPATSCPSAGAALAAYRQAISLLAASDGFRRYFRWHRLNLISPSRVDVGYPASRMIGEMGVYEWPWLDVNVFRARLRPSTARKTVARCWWTKMNTLKCKHFLLSVQSLAPWQYVGATNRHGSLITKLSKRFSIELWRFQIWQGWNRQFSEY